MAVNAMMVSDVACFGEKNGVSAAALLAQVDWAQPWLAHLSWPQHPPAGSVADALNVVPSCPVRFAPGDAAPAGEAYEAFIRRTGQVPTRDNLHDLFNGLVWLHFPRTKARLNELQAAEIARQGVGAVRGPVRDAITLFDENGALLLAPEPLWQALLARDWGALFTTHRALWAQARLVLFGHALMEQLVAPRKNLTAHVLVERLAPDMGPCHGPVTALDQALAVRLSAERLATKPFTPLPVLGVPGWWAANADPAFYADTGVFRPPRPPKPTPPAA